MCLLAAKAFGAAYVCITDLRASRAAFARTVGADSTDPKGQTFDVVMECTGAPSAISQAIHQTRSGGVVCLVGLGPDKVTLPLVDAATREVDIRGIFRYSNTYPLALDLIATRRVDVKPAMTHHYPFTEQGVGMAFRAAFKGEDDAGKLAVKVIVHVGGDKQGSKL
jgi:L-iditol 2-dehydrogenase